MRGQMVRGRASAVAWAAAVSLLLPAVAVGAERVSVAGLETNANAAPLGIDDPTPRLQWRLTSEGRDVRQDKFRVVVATTADRAQLGQADVWDSGQVQSREQHVDYDGPALASGTRYFWSVRSWVGEDGAPTAWAKPAWFETAYLSPGDWRGQWISGPARTEAVLANQDAFLDDLSVLNPSSQEFCRPSNQSPNSGACKEVRPAPLLRKSFTVQPVSAHGEVVSARVYAAGLGWNDMTLNGDPTAADTYLNPGFTSYDKTVEYTTDDVTGLIRQSPDAATENVIAAQLGSGRFDNEAQSGNHGWERAEWRTNPTLRADLLIRYADGTEQVVASDGSWQTSAAGPIRYDNYDLGETYDARKEIRGWDEPGFAATGWTPARTVVGPKGGLRAQEQERTAEVASWPAGTRTEPAPRVYVWNTGQQRTGWATVAVSGAPAGTPIQIRYAEKLGADGQVSISGYAPAGQIQTDYYIAKGTGTAQNPELYTPRFTFKGFQFVQISGVSGTPLPAGVTAEVVKTHEVRTAMRPTGSFEASSDLLNRIHETTKASLVANYVAGTIMDTPTYEKDGWTGDASLTVPAAALMFDTRRQNRHTTLNITDDQYADGQVGLLTPGNAYYGYSGPPSGTTFKPANGGATPIWDSLLFVAPWETYRRFGDDQTLAAAYPHMSRYLTEWIPKWLAADNDGFAYTLTSGLGDWCVPTGADATAGTPTAFNVPRIIAPASTAYTAYMAKVTADSARALGRSEDAAKFDALYENIRTDFNRKWFDPTVGFYREDSNQVFVQSMHVLALAFDLVPAERRRSIQEQLVRDVLDTRQGHQMTGIAGARWFYPVLSEAAYEGVPRAADAAYAAATQTTYPSYGRWLALGWTGLGEYWEASSRTRNHHMFGSIAQWFYEGLVGIQPARAGYREIAFKPTIADGIDHAKASIETVRGTAAAEWRQDDSGLVYAVTVPAGATGKVYLPTSGTADVTETGSGRTVGAADARGVSSTTVSGDHVVVTVRSGEYEFRVTR